MSETTAAFCPVSVSKSNENSGLRNYVRRGHRKEPPAGELVHLLGAGGGELVNFQHQHYYHRA